MRLLEIVLITSVLRCSVREGIIMSYCTSRRIGTLRLRLVIPLTNGLIHNVARRTPDTVDFKHS